MTIIKTKEEYFKVQMEKYFGFLVTNFGFIKFTEYQIPHEVHNDFIKHNLIIKIVYDGGYWVDILKPLKNIDEILNLEKCTCEFSYDSFKRYNLIEIDFERQFYNSISQENFPDKEIWYYSELLKNNIEILECNFKKFKYSYKLIQKIKNILNIKK